jgi:hypothetical protein
MQKAKKKVIVHRCVARGDRYILRTHIPQKHNMTKAKILANFVKAEYTASRFAVMKHEKVVASRGSLKWVRCSASVVCSHAVPARGGRKAFADYLVSASVDAEDASADAVVDGADD